MKITLTTENFNNMMEHTKGCIDPKTNRPMLKHLNIRVVSPTTIKAITTDGIKLCEITIPVEKLEDYDTECLNYNIDILPQIKDKDIQKVSIIFGDKDYQIITDKTTQMFVRPIDKYFDFTPQIKSFKDEPVLKEIWVDPKALIDLLNSFKKYDTIKIKILEDKFKPLIIEDTTNNNIWKLLMTKRGV